MDWAQGTLLNPGDLYTSAIHNVIVNDIPYFDWKVTSKTVNTTTTETDLFNGEISLPAGVMGSNERLHGWAPFELLNNTGAATLPPRFKLKLDSTVLFDSGTIGGTPFAASATRGSGQIYFTIQNLGASNAQEASWYGWVVDGAKANLTTGSGVYSVLGTNSGFGLHGRVAAAFDTTGAPVVALTVINPSALATWETKLNSTKVAIGV